MTTSLTRTQVGDSTNSRGETCRHLRQSREDEQLEFSALFKSWQVVIFSHSSDRFRLPGENLQPTDGECEQYIHKYSTCRVAHSIITLHHANTHGSRIAHLCVLEIIVIHVSCLTCPCLLPLLFFPLTSHPQPFWSRWTYGIRWTITLRQSPTERRFHADSHSYTKQIVAKLWRPTRRDDFHTQKRKDNQQRSQLVHNIARHKCTTKESGGFRGTVIQWTLWYEKTTDKTMLFNEERKNGLDGGCRMRKQELT